MNLRDAAVQVVQAYDAHEPLAAVMEELRAALAEPTVKESLQVEPTVAENATAEFDHSVGADRFRVVRGAFWWHVLIGDSTTEHGKFRTKASAEKMAADLLREFRNGAFVQHQGGGNLPPPLQEATVQQQIEDTPPSDYRRGYWDGFRIGKRERRIAAEDALAEPTVPSDCADSHQLGCDHCNSPLWCGTKCKSCGRKA